ncbi:MAG: hypothetical protein QOD65_1389 [Gaiellales bacterium]|nr:hypothetical protein [Gaiellales bacterium]
MRRLAVGLLTAFASLAAALPVAAESVDRATYQRLLAAAPADRAALAGLRAVTAVDGRPVDLRRALDGSPARVRARLAALRATSRERAPDAAAARRSAAAILAGPDYRPRKGGVLARALSWLGDLLSIPAGASGVVGLIVLGGAVAAVAGLIALVAGTARRSRRRERSLSTAAGVLGVGSARPEELDRQAAAAEAAGRFEEAMRLQLAAALTRLDEAGAIRVRRDTTVGQVARSLRSPHFDAAAVRFAGVVYGRRPPTVDDAADLRERLAATVDEAARR